VTPQEYTNMRNQLLLLEQATHSHKRETTAANGRYHLAKSAQGLSQAVEFLDKFAHGQGIIVP
jgi:hypothetical protein